MGWGHKDMQKRTSLTDYDTPEVIRAAACMLEIPGFHPQSGRTLEELFEDIENLCPDVAATILEQTWQKDKLQAYLNSRPRTPEGWIVVGDDPELKRFYKGLCDLINLRYGAIRAAKEREKKGK
jgi:Uma2 family endonuclease